MLNLQKINYFLSFHSPILHSKIHERRGTFFERRGGNSLKCTYVERKGTCKTSRDTNMEGGVSKIRNFERTYFLNAPILKCEEDEIGLVKVMRLAVKRFKAFENETMRFSLKEI